MSRSLRKKEKPPRLVDSSVGRGVFSSHLEATFFSAFEDEALYNRGTDDLLSPAMAYTVIGHGKAVIVGVEVFFVASFESDPKGVNGPRVLVAVLLYPRSLFFCASRVLPPGFTAIQGRFAVTSLVPLQPSLKD